MHPIYVLEEFTMKDNEMELFAINFLSACICGDERCRCDPSGCACLVNPKCLAEGASNGVYERSQYSSTGERYA